MARRPLERAFHDDVTRAVASLSLGMVKDVDKRDVRRRELGLKETFEMFQIPIAGEAATDAVWTSVSLTFDYHFYYSPGTHESELTVPNMMFGAELGAQVMLSAYVSSWTRDPDNEAVTGAAVEVGAAAPGALDVVPFSGTVHLTFAGWASLYEDESEMTE